MFGIAPVRLAPNQPPRPYRGGERIARFRGSPGAASDGWRPEDFVGSTTTIWGSTRSGLSQLPDGRLIRDAVAAEPLRWLGGAHVGACGPSTELLVKLLDTAERLFVHFHPDDGFARRALGRPRGKTEAWVVLQASPDAYALLGFAADMPADRVQRWVRGQDVDALLAAMRRVPLAAGDTIYVPAGLPHAIGPGVLLAEVQQPSDLSILLESAGFPRLHADDAYLGLGVAQAVQGLHLDALDPTGAAALVGQVPAGAGIHRLLPSAAARFFRAEWIRVSTPIELAAAFAIAVVVDGDGRLTWSDGDVAVRRGDTVLVPHGAGAIRLSGPLEVLRFRPPHPRRGRAPGW